MPRFLRTASIVLGITVCLCFPSLLYTQSQDDEGESNSKMQDIEQMARDIQEQDELRESPDYSSLIPEKEVAPGEDDRALAKNLAENLKKEMVLKSEENEILAEQHYQTGLKYYKRGYYKKAIEEFEIVQDLIKNYRKTKAYLTKAQRYFNRSQHIEKSKEMTKATLEESRDIFLQGQLLFKSGYYDQAYEKFEQVLEVDQGNILARRYMDQILEEKKALAERDREISYKKRMLEIEDSWVTSTMSAKETEPKEEQEEKSKTKSAQQLMLEKKANQIIPEINFTNANLRDVINYLAKISGVNIILDENAFKRDTVKKAAAGAEEEVVSELDSSEEIQPISNKVTISLTNVPLLEALRYILAEKGLKFRIDEFAILISTPERLSEVEMETRYYQLVSGIGGYTEFETKKETEEEGGGEAFSVKATTTIVDVLKQSGVPFPEGSRIFLDQRTGILIVKNTPTNLSIIEDIIKTLDVTPFQVQIEAKFVEVSHSKLSELGLEWLVRGRSIERTSSLNSAKTSSMIEYDGTQLSKGIRFKEDIESNVLGDIFTISGVLTNPEYQLILHALQQNTNTDVLSAPRVTTVNNQQAQIKIVREIRYPEEYEVTQPTFNETGSIVTPAVVIPGDFQTRETGIILVVTPSVGADRKTITLTLLPEVSELVAWMDYGMNFGNMSVPLQQPIFSSSNASTTIIVNDGETVVMGGLMSDDIKSYKDKVPVLGDLPFIGRAFRSRVDETIKKNLLIFVTANLLTPTGGRLREETKEIL